jgi:hypothetical protein
MGTTLAPRERLVRKGTIAMADEEYIDPRLEHMAEEALVKARRKR